MVQSSARIRGREIIRLSFLAALSLAFPLAALTQVAEEAPAAAIQTYTPDDFAQFAPRTAGDMVSQIPGFQISEEDSDSRGFGQAQENILINGQRISSKSTSALDTLNRIPATNVVSIELLDGAKLDIPGLNGQVVNVIAESDGVSGSWSYSHIYREGLAPALNAFGVSLSGERGDLQWTLSALNFVNLRSSGGRENIVDANNNLIEYRGEFEASRFDDLQLSGALTWAPASGQIANLNAKYVNFTRDYSEYSDRYLPNDELFAKSNFGESEDQWNSEISGDYEFGLGPGRLKLIALQRNAHIPEVATAISGNTDGSSQSSEIFDQTVDESESILRTEYNWSTAPSRNWQISLEGAFNTLDSEAALFAVDDLVSTPLAVPLPNPNVKVEEYRGEAFITHGRQLTPSVRLQTSLGVEISEITSSGTSGQTRTFTRPKGSVSANWQINDKLTLNTTLERAVGQLDFFDFVSSIDLDDGDNDTGNVDIVPEQSWRLTVEAERNFDAWGALTAEVFAESLEDINDQVPIIIGQDANQQPIFGEGPGNIESGSRIGAFVDGTVKFDPLGLPGAQFDYYLELADSSIDDPLTGLSRQINRDLLFEQIYEFRHDIAETDYAWGITYDYDEEALSYRRNNTTENGESPGVLSVFFVHKDIFGLTGTVRIRNLADQDRVGRRVIYTPDRAGTISRIEDRSRNYGNVLTLSIEGSF